MNVGIAAVIIFALYLIDKRNRWRAAATAGASLLTLSVIAVLGIFGYTKYDHWRSARLVPATALQSCVGLNDNDRTTRQAWEVDQSPMVEPNYVRCGIDDKGHIVLFDYRANGGCAPPPPTGYILDERGRVNIDLSAGLVPKNQDTPKK